MKHILITGQPGSGKTAMIKRLAEIFKEFNPTGFYTSEIIESGSPAGIEIASLSGDTKTVAHISLKSRQSIGKYKVDLKGFEDFIKSIFSKDKKTNFFIIDEIGKLGCKSKKFSKLVLELLNSEKPVIASISDRGTGFITQIKRREDVTLFEITSDNFELRLKELVMIIRDILLG